MPFTVKAKLCQNNHYTHNNTFPDSVSVDQWADNCLEFVALLLGSAAALRTFISLSADEHNLNICIHENVLLNFVSKMAAI